MTERDEGPAFPQAHFPEQPIQLLGKAILATPFLLSFRINNLLEAKLAKY